VPPETRRKPVIVPAVLAAALGAVLGTLGWFGVGFGQGTVCTDFNEAPHACDALYNWLKVGLIGQWVLVLISGLVLAVGRRRLQSRKAARIAAWVMVALTVGWFSFCYLGAYHSFKVHA